jgi:cyanophycin synthetase
MKILRTQTLAAAQTTGVFVATSSLLCVWISKDIRRRSHRMKSQGFYEGLIDVLPSLVEHYCSPVIAGGFFERVRTGTYMGHIIEHIALELQELAGTPVGFGRTQSHLHPGVYNVVFEYVDEQAGRYAGRAAVRLCQSLVDTGTYPKQELAQDLADLRDFMQ